MIKIIAPALIKDRPQTQVYYDIVNFFNKEQIIKNYEVDYNLIKDNDPHIEAINNHIYLLPLILRDLHNGDILFWADARNPLLPAVWKYCISKRIKIKNVGIFWGSCRDSTSFFCKKVMSDYEEYTIKYFDYIFVPTFYLKSIIEQNTKKDNVIVTSMPFNLKVLQPRQIKEETIVYGHRWVSSKHPESFLLLARRCLDDNISLQFLVLSSTNITRQIKQTNKELGNIIPNICTKNSIVQCKVVSKFRYYQEIGKAKYIFAHSDHETFGYFVLESILSGAIPIINNHPCYIELYGHVCYSNKDEMLDRLINIKSYDSNKLIDDINNSLPLMYKYTLSLETENERNY